MLCSYCILNDKLNSIGVSGYTNYNDLLDLLDLKDYTIIKEFELDYEDYKSFTTWYKNNKSGYILIVKKLTSDILTNEEIKRKEGN